ncbi:hypothetical protein [Thalassorhabdomicrobium marinisediminis]|uniref:Uncharacterized protein n=1 Tax=Thalassorhabdomicrobium marinisediminis TaxID=2170577 RepID=A0A2T7G0T5_9RHOB|nr:hypothetical protein [Thalassorhabdomicrobium marinisediminis]PVA08034.1 hypothetical protein DC363_00600 [Thalassorhabdomicrobium marinisediminis]
MTQHNKPAPDPSRMSHTFSFGAHRMGDRPASAVASGASSMPAAWQSREAPKAQPFPGADSVRSLGDIALDPLRWVLAATWRKAVCAGLLGALVVMLA